MRKLYTFAIFFLSVFLCSSIHAQNSDNKRLLELIKKNAAQLHISDSDAGNAVISNAYTDAQTNIQYVYLQQAYKGVKVFNSIMTIIFRDAEVLYSSGKFVYDIQSKAGDASPSLEANVAVFNAAQHLKLPAPVRLNMLLDKMATEKKFIFSPANISKKEIETELVWVASDDNASVKLAWNVNIDVLNTSDWWNVRVDAINGQVIEKDNWTVYEDNLNGNCQSSTQKNNNRDFKFFLQKPFTNQQKYFTPPPTVTSAGYYVIPYPYESPKHKPLAMENQPWLKAGAGNSAITNGWHFDGTTNYDVTRGNNVFAYLDVQNTNTPNSTQNWPDTSSTANPSLTFGNIPNFSQPPSVGFNKKSAITNLFYWNNIIHDVTYQYGFNELSGNFQADNMSRGGNGADYVQAEAQDASGTNNANFSTPADGTRPRMQMYLWTGNSALIVNAPGNIAGSYAAVEGNLSTSNLLANMGAVTGQLVYFNDAAATTHDACNGAPSNSLTGKIALIDRNVCSFVIKIKEAQNAGAIGVVMVNNVPGAPITMGGADNTITIPAMMISQSDGAILAAQLGNNVNVTLSPPIGIDGDHDNGIIVHEYGHGVSNRFTGGPANSSCLSNAEQAGEGWSDYLGLMLTTNWSAAQLSDGGLSRPIGTYAFKQPINGAGIRTYPYSTNMSVNPLTYSNLAANTEVHFIGEVWCAALWDMTWNIIQQAGSISTNFYNSNAVGGNAIAMKLVLEGMRLQPCRPGFLDARDAILAADSILYNGAHKCAIWKAFARRGMGFSAVQGLSSNAADQVAAFDVPSAIYLSKDASPSILTNGGQKTINLAASCQCLVPSNNYTLRDTIPAGFTYISSTGGGTLNGNVVSFSALNFTTEQQTKSFSITVQANTSGCFVDTAINDDRTVTFGGLTSAIISGATQWLPSNARSKSPSTSWLATTPVNAEDFTLTSNSFTVGNLSVLSFWHYYVTENRADGGTVELSTNGGTTWIDAGPYMVQNGYNTLMDAITPWGANQKAFSGVSYAQGSNQFINTVINLSSFSGQNMKMRFRMRTDAGNPGIADGWFIDDIMQLNGCGGIIKAGLYNASNVKIDSSVVPLFIKATGTPVTLSSQPAASIICPGANTSFTVAATGGTLTYKWQVSTNNGTSYTDVPGGTAATLNLTNVTVSMNGYLYRCIVDNGSNSATSSTALLTVNAVTNAGSVSNVSSCAGTTAAFTSNASGANLTYQWQVSTDGGINFTNISSATAATLSLANTTTTQNGNKYRVVVVGACGTANSSAATLNINNSPVVSINNAPAKLCTTDAAYTLTASQTGGVWSGQGIAADKFVPIGLTAATYIVSYSVTNSFGCVGTATASIVVDDCTDKHLLLSTPGAIIIYPNPNNGNFKIKFNTDLYTKLSMKVYGSDGKLVSVKTISGITYGMVLPVNLFNLASDVYLLSLYDEKSGKEKTFKLMIAR